jgi:ATP-dependent RNA helicase RhlE
LTFEELNLSNPLLNALADLEYIHPTPIQEKSFALVMSGKDLVGVAQTGTGKTFAYLLPLLRQLKFSNQRQPRILIVVPTRELVLQVVNEIKKLTKYMTVRAVGVYGGTNINTQKQLVYDGSDILVATPGRLIDLTLTGVLRLTSVQKLVIDEVDEMLNLGFRSQLVQVMELLPENRQNIMFSATLTEDVENLINDFFFDTQKIEIAPHGTPLKNIIQKVYFAQNFNTKVNLLKLLLQTDSEMSKVLIFCGSKKNADRLHALLTPDFGEMCGVIHSNKSQNLRFNSVRKFHEGEIRLLIASDIAARGLDISDVTHVLNFDTPEIPEDYIHRIGRTGRIDKIGTAITFADEAEKKYLGEIENLMKIKIPIENLPDNLKISEIYTSEEKPLLYDKEYLKKPKPQNAISGAFHEKKEKNKKVNSGSPSKKGKTAEFQKKAKQKARRKK